MGTVAGLTRDGALLTLDRHLVETLRSALRGPLLAAGDPGYEEARSTLGGGFGYLELARDLGHVVTVAGPDPCGHARLRSSTGGDAVRSAWAGRRERRRPT